MVQIFEKWLKALEVKEILFIKDFFRLRRIICSMGDSFIRYEFASNRNIL